MTATTPAMELLAVDGGHLAWRESGHGDTTVVWVHGLPLDSSSWRAQEASFADATRNVLPDLRGYGRSSPLPRGDDVTGLYVDDLHALITGLELDHVVLVGFASAGHVALRYAARHPERLRGLVTLNASPRFRAGPGWPWGFTDDAVQRFVDLGRAGDIEGLTAAVLDPATVFRDVDAARGEELARWFAAMSRRAGAETLLGFFTSIAADDDRALAERIDVPTLLLASTAGLEVPTGVGLWLREHIPHARLAELPGADHFAFATRPDTVNRLIADFLAELDTRHR